VPIAGRGLKEGWDDGDVNAIELAKAGGAAGRAAGTF